MIDQPVNIDLVLWALLKGELIWEGEANFSSAVDIVQGILDILHLKAPRPLLLLLDRQLVHLHVGTWRPFPYKLLNKCTSNITNWTMTWTFINTKQLLFYPVLSPRGNPVCRRKRFDHTGAATKSTPLVHSSSGTNHSYFQCNHAPFDTPAVKGVLSNNNCCGHGHLIHLARFWFSYQT